MFAGFLSAPSTAEAAAYQSRSRSRSRSPPVSRSRSGSRSPSRSPLQGHLRSGKSPRASSETRTANPPEGMRGTRRRRNPHLTEVQSRDLDELTRTTSEVEESSLLSSSLPLSAMTMGRRGLRLGPISSNAANQSTPLSPVMSEGGMEHRLTPSPDVAAPHSMPEGAEAPGGALADLREFTADPCPDDNSVFFDNPRHDEENSDDDQGGEGGEHRGENKPAGRASPHSRVTPTVLLSSHERPSTENLGADVLLMGQVSCIAAFVFVFWSSRCRIADLCNFVTVPSFADHFSSASIPSCPWCSCDKPDGRKG